MMVINTALPYNNFTEIKTAFSSEQANIEFLELIRWNKKIQSPFDKKSKVYKCGNGKYRCKNTHKYFTVKTGTVFDGTKLPLQCWFAGIIVFLNKNGNYKLSRNVIVKEFNITPRTAWFLFNKIGYALKYIKFNPANVFETDFKELLCAVINVPRKKPVRVSKIIKRGQQNANCGK